MVVLGLTLYLVRTLQYFKKNIAHKKLKKPLSKVAQKNSNPLFFPYCLTAQMAQTEEFMFQNVELRPTVYRTGVPDDITILDSTNCVQLKYQDIPGQFKL